MRHARFKKRSFLRSTCIWLCLIGYLIITCVGNSFHSCTHAGPTACHGQSHQSISGSNAPYSCRVAWYDCQCYNTHIPHVDQKSTCLMCFFLSGTKASIISDMLILFSCDVIFQNPSIPIIWPNSSIFSLFHNRAPPVSFL